MVTGSGPDRVGDEDRLDFGIVGVSEGNGHPYSFASILNGYSDEGFENADWDVIHDYLREKDPSEIGFDGVGVTHAWTQDPEETERLCDAALIPNAVNDLDSLADSVDAVIVARDDYESHTEMAIPFLERGMPVFIDKPLTMDLGELAQFRPYLERGQLMSCSGMRYAQALDELRAHTDRFGDVSLIRGTVIKDWPRYGAHMLDAIFGVLDQRPATVKSADADHTSVSIRMDGGTVVTVDTLGDVPMTFSVDVYGSEHVGRYDLTDNFTAFRRTLWRFVRSVRTGEPTLDPQATVDVIRTLIAGRIADREDRRVALNELEP